MLRISKSQQVITRNQNFARLSFGVFQEHTSCVRAPYHPWFARPSKPQKIIVRNLFHCLLFLLIFFAISTSHAAISKNSATNTQMLKQAVAAIVNVKTYGILPINQTIPIEDDEDDEDDTSSAKNKKHLEKPRPFTSIGSGIIINAAKGWVITNAHILKDSEKVVVTLQDGQQYIAQKIGVDEPSDTALLQINAPHLTQVPIANSNSLAVGDPIYAIGNPFGLGTSVSSGIISALERSNLQLERYENFIQIDAPINPGNSGGALMNTHGEVVGMNTAILTDSGGNIGIGFAIPSNMLTAVIPQLLKYGKVERGIIGFTAQTFSATLANAMNLPNQEGAIVTSVMPLSPAEKAGIQVGDIITQIDNVPIHTSSQVINTVGFLRTGTPVELTLLRHKKTLEVSVTIMDAEKQKDLIQKETPYFNNVSLQNFSFYSPDNGHVNGVILVEVAVDSATWLAGLRPGDIVLSANNEPAISVQKLQQSIANAKETLTLLVLRAHDTVFIVLTPEKVSHEHGE